MAHDWSVVFSRRKYVVLGVIALAVAGLVCAFVFGPSREPEYRGKRLSEWMEECALPAGATFLAQSVLLSNPPPASYRLVHISGMRSLIPADAEEAIGSIGTNALLYLVKWIRYEPPAWKTKLLTIINKTFHRAKPDREQIRADGAEIALIGLGSKAEGAVPSLACLMNDTNAATSGRRATFVLSALQGTVFAAAMSLVTNNSASVRLDAINSLARSGSPLGPAVPVLIQSLGGTNTEIAKAAAEMLGIGRAEARLAVPALVKSLQDERLVVRRTALVALGKFHREARPAIPAVAVLLQDPDVRTRNLAADVLHDIDPAALEKLTAR